MSRNVSLGNNGAIANKQVWLVKNSGQSLADKNLFSQSNGDDATLTAGLSWSKDALALVKSNVPIALTRRQDGLRASERSFERVKALFASEMHYQRKSDDYDRAPATFSLPPGKVRTSSILLKWQAATPAV